MGYGYSVAPGDRLMVGEYDAVELASLLSPDDLAILRRYVAPMLTDDGRVVVLMPMSVYAAAPESVQAALGELVEVLKGQWDALIARCEPVTEERINDIMGEISPEEWRR